MYYGDPQIYTKTDVAAKGWAATLATSTTKFPGTDFLMTAGDNVDSYDPATQPAEWDLFLAPQQITQYAMAPAVGNHDNANGTGVFNEHYGVPNRTSLGQTAPGTGDYWFVYNHTLFLVMNTNSLDLVAHKEFIDQAKAAAGHVEWIVADFHHATFSSADHPNDADVTYLRANLTPILSAEGVDLVLNGHDHDYARSYLMNGSTIVPGSNGSVLKPKEGQVLYVATNSSSGGKFYPLTGPYPWTVVTNQENVANYTRVEVNEGKLVVTTYRATDNSIVDRVTLKK
jgi:3',5'-cyclic AMP phosphodiesterase CpdA